MTDETYTFGYAGNSYFNGRDGRVERASDDRSITINSYDGHMAVKVKDHRNYWDLSDLPEGVQSMAKDLNDSHGEVQQPGAPRGWNVEYVGTLYERAREQWWEDADWLAEEAGFDKCFSAGRSGGWCVVRDTSWLADNFPSTPEPPEGYVPPCCYCGEPESDAQEHGEGGHTFDPDREPFAERDRFLALAFDLVELIDTTRTSVLVELIQEAHEELEAARERNTILSEN